MPRYSSSLLDASPATRPETSSVLSLHRHVEVSAAEPGHRHGQAIAVVAGLLDVIGRVGGCGGRFLRGVHETRETVEADRGAEQGSEVVGHV